MSTHFFISYAKKDTRDLAIALNDALNAISGVTAWVDKSLEVGRSFEVQIQTQIDLCDFMIVLYSPDINRHKLGHDESYMLNEIGYAKSTLKKSIIPVMAQTTQPPMSLTTYHYIDFTRPNMTLRDLVMEICAAVGISSSSVSSGQNLVIQPFPIYSPQDVVGRAKTFRGLLNREWTPFVDIFEVKGISFEMCLVPPGTFPLGGTKYSNEQPVHSQTISQPFWIMRYPVTNAQWRSAVMRSVGAVTIPEWASWYHDRSMDEHPVVGVTWHQCHAFTKWLGEMWKLPTEAEWEYSARGLQSWDYPWGNDWQPERVVFTETSTQLTAAVRGRPNGASWVSAQDMSGNVWEWTSSFYRPYPYRADDGREAIMERATYANRVVRGGAGIDTNFRHLRIPTRSWHNPSSKSSKIGFRCVRSL